jgi:hypothetical protein
MVNQRGHPTFSENGKPAPEISYRFPKFEGVDKTAEAISHFCYPDSDQWATTNLAKEKFSENQ